MRSLDYLRGRYVHAPQWVQRPAGTLLSVWPAGLLYGKTFRELRADIARSEWDAAFVEERTRAQLAALFSKARQTRYYAGRLAEIPVNRPTMADLASLPVLRKQEVLDNVEGMLAASRAEMDEVMTGGTSSGVQASFYLDRDRSVKEWAFLTHLWQRCGYRPGNRLAVLGYRGVTHISSPSSRPWAWEPGTRELRLSPFRMVPPVMDRYLALLGHYRIAFVYGYPSAISILGAYARNVGWSPPKSLRGVLLMSESIRPSQCATIREGFGPLPLLACYGLSEKVAIAGEIPGSPGEYEFEPLYGVAELLDAAGSPISVPGQQGTLVGTGLISMGMPLIRYDTGDLATAVAVPTAGNCWRLRVKDIVSSYRQDYLVTREGGLITPVVLYDRDWTVRECQFVQDEPGKAVLRIVPEQGVEQGELEALRAKINRHADGLVSVELAVVDEIPLTPRGKRLMVEQHLDLSGYRLTAEDDAGEPRPA